MTAKGVLDNTAMPARDAGASTEARDKDPLIPSIWRLVARRNNAIVEIKSGDNGPAFYCVHSITGDAGFLHDLAGHLNPKQQIYGIQVSREKMSAAFAASVEAIARDHVKSLLAHQQEGPIILGGWSAGAIIALEMAQQLRAIGRNVPLLIAFDGAPCNTGGGLSRWDLRYALKLICNVPRWLMDGQVNGWSWPTFARRISDRIDFRLQVAGASISTEQTLQGDQVHRLLHRPGWSREQTGFIRALWNAMRTYVPKPYPGRVILYEARIQPFFHLLQLGAAWRKIAPNVEIVPLRGGHGSILRQPNVSVLTAHLRMRLEELQTSFKSTIK